MKLLVNNVLLDKLLLKRRKYFILLFFINFCYFNFHTICKLFEMHFSFIYLFLQIDAKTDEKITFAEMRDRSVRCALWLRKQGINENDVVGMSTPIQKHDYIPYLGTLFINSILNSWACDASSGKKIYINILIDPKYIK